jgi:hypothetical protein
MSLPVKKKEKYAWLLTDVRKISLLPNEIKNNFRHGLHGFRFNQ